MEVEKEVNGEKQKTALLPGEIKESQIQTKYIYYLPHTGYESREELEPVLTSESPAAEYVEKYDKNFEKKRKNPEIFLFLATIWAIFDIIK